MSESTTTLAARPSHTSGESSLVQRRVRHVTSIQIRNLTPFPVRDAFASALTQPAEQSQFTSHGHLTDDLDVTISRKRSRRISTNSNTTHRSIRSDDGTGDEGLNTLGERGRRTSASRVSFPSGGSNQGRPYYTSGPAPTIRPHRPRTTSMASSIGSHLSNPFNTNSGSSAPYTPFLPDNTQAGLEKVIKSRLVETFLTITIPQPMGPTPTSPNPGPRPSTRPVISHATSFLREKSQNMSQQMSGNSDISGYKVGRASDKGTRQDRRGSSSSVKAFPSKLTPAHVKSASMSTVHPNGKNVSTSYIPSSSQKLSSTPEPLKSPSPNYFSPIHRPSTNPDFPVDTRSRYEFRDGSNFSGHMMKIEVWGKLGKQWRKDEVLEGKGKERETELQDIEWKILDEWEVDLGDLVPLPEELIMHPSELPSNTLIITLSPPGKAFYLPPHSTRSKPPSPGYTSDPESEARRVKQHDSSLQETIPDASDSTNALSQKRHRDGMKGNSGAASGAKTSGWQDLFKLVTLQSCILDNEVSLTDIVRGIDGVLETDVISNLRREVSEREARVEELKANHKIIILKSQKLVYDIAQRKELLRKRKEMLGVARHQHILEVNSELDVREEIIQHRTRHLSLHSQFGPTRTTLLTILSTIFPIELLSPPDLLYTILDVPLPIPFSASDPAPPLTLSTHKEVNDEVVATSLGYAAQVVQLLAAYLGKGLVYPVTCVGSRSLIKDGISAMVGPRMFPLFSKGVDTYRFEYGVFLLNKDIELLMADRDLRALDMRHTLPNLKNLLLTLTNGEGVSLKISRPKSPMTSDLESLSSRPDSPVDPNSTTPKAVTVADLPSEGGSPPASGSTTPTTAIPDNSKKARPFLGFSPLTDFLWARQPSSSRAAVNDLPEVTSEASEASDGRELNIRERSEVDDEEDRTTIHGIVRDADNLMEQNPRSGSVSMGDAEQDVLQHLEKIDGKDHSPSYTTLSLPLNRVN